MAERYRGTGWKLPFLVFWLCDETFALNYTARVPADTDRSWFYFFVSLFNYLYWVSGSLLGGLAGAALSSLPLEGMSFVMTAMFVVIFLEQLLHERRPWTALIGIAAAAGCLRVFGAEDFMLPAMGLILAAVTLFRRPLERAAGGAS